MHETTARAAAALWPPDDTEESVLGTNIHQDTITTVRGGVNQAASRAARPWRAGGQTNVAGFFRPDGSAYTTLPDVFVYRVPFDRRRATLSLAADGPPALIVEVLSPETYGTDLDLERGKGYSYRRGGVAEYLTLDPLGRYLREQGRGWRLVGGTYVPWERGPAGRWASDLGIGIGFEGVRVIVYDAGGREMPDEDHVQGALDDAEARGLAAGEARGMVAGEERGLLVGTAMLIRLLSVRFGPPPPALESRLRALTDLATVDALANAVLDAPSLAAFIDVFDRAGS